MAARLDDASIRIRIDPREAENSLEDLEKSIGDMEKKKAEQSKKDEDAKRKDEAVAKKGIAAKPGAPAGGAGGIPGMGMVEAAAGFFEDTMPGIVAFISGVVDKKAAETAKDPGAIEQAVRRISQTVSDLRAKMETIKPAAKDTADIARMRIMLGGAPPTGDELFALGMRVREQKEREAYFDRRIELERNRFRNRIIGRMVAGSVGM